MESSSSSSQPLSTTPNPPNPSSSSLSGPTASSTSAPTSSTTTVPPSTVQAGGGPSDSTNTLDDADVADADVDMLNPPPPTGRNAAIEEEEENPTQVPDGGNQAASSSAAAGTATSGDDKGKEPESSATATAAPAPRLAVEDTDAELAGMELKTATRKDRNLREFLNMMEEYAPIIPDAVADYYLSLGGFASSDPRIKRLLALATQKFIADIAADAYQYHVIRSTSSAAGGGGAFAPGGGGGVGGIGGLGGGGGMAFMGGGSAAAGGRGRGRTVLTMDDLSSAAREFGLNVTRPEFYR